MVAQRVIFAATDSGVFATLDGGNDWQRLGNNMPVVPVYELCFNIAKQEVVAGMFARSMYSYSLDSLGVQINPGVFTHVKNYAGDFQVRLYPNPASEYVIIETYEQSVKAEIYNAAGKRIFRSELSGSLERINLTSLSSGYYWIRFSSPKGNTVSKFFRLG